MSDKESRKCKICGETLHVMDFRIQKEDYLGLFEICLECEPAIVEKIKAAVLSYSKKVSPGPVQVESKQLPQGTDGKTYKANPPPQYPFFAADLISMQGLKPQAVMLQHLLMVIETALEILGSLANNTRSEALTKYIGKASKQLRSDHFIVKNYLKSKIIKE